MEVVQFTHDTEVLEAQSNQAGNPVPCGLLTSTAREMARSRAAER
jgi:hypothetical protein